jgi:L-asparaginase
MTAPLPRIAVIGTGGTISSLGASSLDVLDYPDFGQKLTCEALLERFPETRLVADPLPATFRQVGSTDIGPKDWREIRALIHRLAREEPAVAGFVIPHGTATLEETAFFLNLTLASTQPVVLVGAQRPASALGTDAGMNLVNALRIAGSTEARGKGVLVVLNDEIHAARCRQDLDLPAADLPLGRFRRAGTCRWRRRAFLPRPDARSHARYAICEPGTDGTAAGRDHLFLCRR